MSADHTIRDRFEQLLIRWVLVLVPTVVIGYLTLRSLNFSYTSLSTGIVTQTIYFTAGLVLAYSLYHFGARWLITFVALWLLYILSERIISRLPGEFDVFYTTARFQLYSTLFLFGWGFGFLLARIRWSYIIVFAVLMLTTLVRAADTIDLSFDYLLVRVFPVLAYGLYMYFISPLLAGHIDLDRRKSLRLALRFAGFLLMVALAFFMTDRLLRGEIKAVEKEIGARGGKDNDKGGSGGKDKEGGYDERYGLMEKQDDGFKLKDTMKVNTRMSQSDKLMFCSKLDNYFPDGEPIPLYFVYHYLTKYDQARESFVRDVNVPSLDEFEIDPYNLPMYYSYTDTSIIRKSMGKKLRKVVDAQVYLSGDAWKHAVLGPANVFAIQTIPVEKDFQKTFKSAYKVRSFTSELNNAYFVYNISASPQLERIQKQRHDELRTVPDYSKVDREFYEYYVKQPTGGIYDSITALALSLAPMDAKPVDKVLAVRDFFLKRNENGKRIFRYTLKAGALDDPNIPSSRMLYDFLFKTHAGYCTYYAGASLFMLRALGVPTRFTTGFATINRSDKNKGWYWFYASQAHAWTQVYFPGYGWLDFDMTIGNEDQQGAPKPDGTPPLPPPEPWLVLNAKAATVDQATKQLTATYQELLYLDIPYALKAPVTRAVDASMSRVIYDKKDTTLSAIHPGDSVIIVSYKDEARTIPRFREGVSIDIQEEGFPKPIIADEIHIRGKEKEKEKEANGKGIVEEEEKKTDWNKLIWTAVKGLASMILLVILLPLLYLLYRIAKAGMTSSVPSRADEVYRMALYRFHMAGMEREGETPMEYAQTKIDPAFGTEFETFMQLYLRMKYSRSTAVPEDMQRINKFASTIGPSIHGRIGFGRTLMQYFNLALAYRYFLQPQSTDHETSAL